MQRRCLVFGLLTVCLVAHSAHAKDWARKMFEVTEHDFGTVARGTQAEFDFVFQNIYKEDVHIAGVRSSCSCTSPSIINPTLKTWETGIIRAKYNTRSFLGKRTATITVVIDKPYPAEVQLSVAGYIRGDVVFHPGSVNVGDVETGSPVSKTVEINYAGRDSWKIVDVEAPAAVNVSLQETRRGQGRVAYNLVVRLSENAPVGFLAEQIFIVTNDKNLTRIPLTINGQIRSSITVSPELLALGVLQPGERVTKKLLVRSKRPFQVTDVSCDGDCLSFQAPEGSKTLHMIPVTFTAGEEPGELAMKINIETDLGKGAIAFCTATASVQ